MMTFEERQHIHPVIEALSDEGLRAALDHEFEHGCFRAKAGLGLSDYDRDLFAMLRAEETERLLKNMTEGV